MILVQALNMSEVISEHQKY